MPSPFLSSTPLSLSIPCFLARGGRSVRPKNSVSVFRYSPLESRDGGDAEAEAEAAPAPVLEAEAAEGGGG
uniref:Uncharacterized protein n=1 Tax=Oryza glaberrima TaxID=4538 RepID=I1QUI9_ORYGL